MENNSVFLIRDINKVGIWNSFTIRHRNLHKMLEKFSFCLFLNREMKIMNNEKSPHHILERLDLVLVGPCPRFVALNCILYHFYSMSFLQLDTCKVFLNSLYSRSTYLTQVKEAVNTLVKYSSLELPN